MLRDYRLNLYDFPGGTVVKKIHLSVQEMQKTCVGSLGWEDLWSRNWQPAPVFLPGKSHGQRSLAGYSPWGPKALDTVSAALSRYHFLGFEIPQLEVHHLH